MGPTLGLCLVLLALAIYLPGLHQVLGVRDPEPGGLGLALGFSLVPWVVGQVLKLSGKLGDQ